MQQEEMIMSKQVYILGDMLRKGSILLREYEAKVFRALDIPLYSAIEQKDINDKTGVTEEQNNKLAERIVKKDSQAIRESSLIIAETDNNNIGSCVEIGSIFEFNWWHDNMSKLVEQNDINGIKEFLERYPKKEIYFHTTDIRHTQLNEKGYRRSFSFNQYLVGTCLALNPDGILTFRDIIKKIIDKHINVPAKNFIKDMLDTDAMLGELDLQKIKELTHNENRR